MGEESERGDMGSSSWVCSVGAAVGAAVPESPGGVIVMANGVECPWSL